MKNKLCVLILLLIGCGAQLSAQNNYTFPQFGKETVRFIKQPSKWRGDDYLRIGMLSAGTGLLMLADRPIRDAVRKDQRYDKSAPIVLGRMYGGILSPVTFFSCFAGYSLIAHDLKARKIAYEIGQASLYAGAINIALKIAIGRARPNVGEGAGTFRPFHSLIGNEYHSFPGGHVTAATTISTVLSRNVKPTWLKILVYAPVALTFTSRVYQDWHWTSDCFAGAAFGYFIGTWVVDQHEQAVPAGTPTGANEIKAPSISLKLIRNLNIGFGQASYVTESRAWDTGSRRPVKTEQRIYLTFDASKIKL